MHEPHPSELARAEAIHHKDGPPELTPRDLLAICDALGSFTGSAGFDLSDVPAQLGELRELPTETRERLARYLTAPTTGNA